MLAPKKMSWKKLSVNFLIMAATIGTSVFLAVKNRLITFDFLKSEEPAAQISSGEISPITIAPVQPEIGITNATSTATNASSGEKSKILDIGIFKSVKFKALEDNISAAAGEKVKMGKTNPFESGQDNK